MPQDESTVTPPHELQAHVSSEVRIRLWPPVGLVLLYVVISCGFAVFGSTNIQSFVALVIVPISTALLLTAWWLILSRAPIRDRVLGLTLLVAGLAWVVFTQASNGVMLLAFALPAMMIGTVTTLVVTFRLRWPLRRRALVAFIAICAGVFTAMRVDTIGGDLMPVVSWRWTPTIAERSQALPRLDAHETAVLPVQITASDWPAFRGPDRDGRVAGLTFSTNWTPPPREVWRRTVGAAWSSFAVIGDHLFTQEQRGEEELVTCYRADTGDEVWVNSLSERYDDTMGLGPRATPTYFEGKLYTQGATGVLQCLDASTGTTLWKRNLTRDTGRDVPMYGFSSSPLVVGGLVIAFSGGGEGKAIVAYRCATGEVAWEAGHVASGYSSPHFAVLGNTPQVLMVSDFGLQAFNPESGVSLWEHAWEVKTNPRCVQPLIAGENLVMFGATGVSGSRLLKVERADSSWKVGTVWSTKNFRPYFNDCVLHKGHCYGFDGER
ncbi:MAG: PQQ-binding-like beta-propeller repeat protein, partial [Candidatus Hydrogenedentales bacterium]